MIEHTSHLLANSAKKRTNYQSASFIFSCRFLGDSLCCPFGKRHNAKKNSCKQNVGMTFRVQKLAKIFHNTDVVKAGFASVNYQQRELFFLSTSKDVKKVQVALFFLVDQIWKGMKLRESNSRSVFASFASRIFFLECFFSVPF